MTPPTEGDHLRAQIVALVAEVERLRAELRPQRHQWHYRSCNCLGDSDRCCVAACCGSEPSGGLSDELDRFLP